MLAVDQSHIEITMPEISIYITENKSSQMYGCSIDKYSHRKIAENMNKLHAVTYYIGDKELNVRVRMHRLY
jgi:hypothetical protein